MLATWFEYERQRGYLYSEGFAHVNAWYLYIQIGQMDIIQRP